jgi:acetate kinase
MHILTLNSGSSSIKFSHYRISRQEEILSTGSAEGIGFVAGSFHVKDGSGKTVITKKLDLRDHGAALKEITVWLDIASADKSIDAAGHRMVHGGSACTEPRLITLELLTRLGDLVPFAPDHLPHEIEAAREIARLYPGMPQVACFDTAFHRTMPGVARLYALPEGVRQHGVERYGFHGLSYEYILSELRKETGQETADGRVIIAHLGNGASMAAFSRGRSMDTTMGFTPAGGLVMSTRSGDLDPGVIIYLLREKGMDAAALNQMVNKQSGLIGVSGTSPDMKDLLDRAGKDRRASDAVQLFCYQAKKFLGALAAVLGGLDTLIFTGGIGENSPDVRELICREMGFLGISIDANRNNANADLISGGSSTVVVRVMKTNEELMIARHTHRLLMKSGRKA